MISLLLTRKMPNLSGGHEMSGGGGYRVYLTPSKRFPCGAFCYCDTM